MRKLRKPAFSLKSLHTNNSIVWGGGLWASAHDPVMAKSNNSVVIFKNIRPVSDCVHLLYTVYVSDPSKKGSLTCIFKTKIYAASTEPSNICTHLNRLFLLITSFCYGNIRIAQRKSLHARWQDSVSPAKAFSGSQSAWLLASVFVICHVRGFWSKSTFPSP